MIGNYTRLVMSAKYFRPQLIRMLGNRQPNEFVRLSEDERAEILCRSQVRKNRPVIVDESGLDDELNPDIAGSGLLRQIDLVGENEDGQQIYREATEIYYRDNTFQVDSHWLEEFLGECGQKRERVRRLNVRVHYIHPWSDKDTNEAELFSAEENEGREMRVSTDRRRRGVKTIEDDADFDRISGRTGGEAITPTIRDLRWLFRVDGVEKVRIEIVGGGVRDGSDFRTQEKVHEISRVVRRLMRHFEGRARVRIFKVVEIRGLCSLAGQEITKWWTRPDHGVVERIRTGEGTFEDIMRVQVAEWTRVHSGYITGTENQWVQYL